MIAPGEPRVLVGRRDGYVVTHVCGYEDEHGVQHSPRTVYRRPAVRVVHHATAAQDLAVRISEWLRVYGRYVAYVVGAIVFVVAFVGGEMWLAARTLPLDTQ